MNVNKDTVSAFTVYCSVCMCVCVCVCVCGLVCIQSVVQCGVERQIAIFKEVSQQSFGKNAV